MRLRQGDGALDVAGAGLPRKAAICGFQFVEGVSGSRRHAIGEEGDTVDQRPRQSSTRKSDKTGNDHPRSVGEWSDILRYFADHELIRGLVAACNLQTAVPQMDPKQAANIYVAASSLVREAIQGGWQVADDTVLVVTLLLYIYELDVAFCNSVVPSYFLILGSQAMRRDVLCHAHDLLAILETRAIVLYRQYCRSNLDQAFLQTAHTLLQDLTYRQKTTVRTPCSSLRHRQDSVLIDGDEQEKEDGYLTALQDRWSCAKLHIYQLVVCRVQSAVFRMLWNTSAVCFEELVPCFQNCPTRASEIMCSSAADVMDDFRSIHLPMHSPSATLGMHGAIFTASSCLESELEELTLGSCGMQSDAITPTQLNSMRRSSRWLTEWSRMLASWHYWRKAI
ncbi:hypothetical protein PISL3812_05907 [Talaromyces islandicus]|uniref:Uncharacterized protein n=1 Tax=Talaromyces islandicus TaxID=28573 RepID=A0A0U1M0B6_TALIS|nr:hypothetical protein PISL3812_05907 [Talaromyces islandicus]